MTNSNWSNNGKRVIAASLASTTGGANTDVIVALSEDGGQTWENGSLQWVNVSGQSSRVDAPFVFSNPQFPWDTYVAWTGTDSSGAQQGYLRQVTYDLASPPNATLGQIIPVPKTATDPVSVSGFRFGFATLPTPCASGGEGIFVVYANQGNGLRCQGTRHSGRDPTMASFDRATGIHSKCEKIVRAEDIAVVSAVVFNAAHERKRKRKASLGIRRLEVGT